ncbi:MAG: hypothetical protein ACREP4_01060 [Stenotrophomonas sp.]|uniref:hypothetical protein n=1 Tax=Stenotrophomonas sp. TaxID=69392 RepID=UPI003D6D99CD
MQVRVVGNPPALLQGLVLDKEKQRKRALVLSMDGKDVPSSVVSRLQPGKRMNRGIAQSEHQCRATEDVPMERFLNEEHVVLYAEFRKSGCTASPGVTQQFDQITRDMLANARSTQVVATLIRAQLGLPDLT